MPQMAQGLRTHSGCKRSTCCTDGFVDDGHVPNPDRIAGRLALCNARSCERRDAAVDFYRSGLCHGWRHRHAPCLDDSRLCTGSRCWHASRGAFALDASHR